MPPAIAAGGALLATTIFGSLTVGGLLASVALSGASFLLQAALAPKPPTIGGFIDKGIKVLSRNAVDPRKYILGRELVGGSLFFLKVKPPFLYYGLEIAGHEIDAVEEIRLGGVNVYVDANGFASASPYVSGASRYAQFSVRLGAPGQAIDPILAADFPELESTFTQSGRATVVCKFDYGGTAASHEIIWGNTQPTPLFLIRGAKLYNPDKPSHLTNDPTTWAWSDNASLAQAWWLTHRDHGNRKWSQLDLESLRIAARNDDLAIGLKAGGSEKQWTINGAILSTEQPFDVIRDLLGANLGELPWSNGKYSFISGGPRSASWTLNDDACRGDMAVQHDAPRRSLANTVETVFTSPEREFQSANGPIIQNAAYLAADGEEHRITAQLPFTTTHTRAQRIGKVLLELARRGKTIAAPYGIDAMRMAATDIVNIESDPRRQLNGIYKILGLKMTENFEWQVEASQWDNDVWQWNPATDEQDFTLDTVL